jgi:hypothetical protein
VSANTRRKRRVAAAAGGGAGAADLLNAIWSVAGTTDLHVQGNAAGTTDPIPFNDVANGAAPARLDVVTAASAGLPAQWPTPNALRVLRSSPAASGWARATTQFPAMIVGSHRYYRTYLCVAYSDLNAPGDSMNNHHPWQNTALGLFNWHWAKHNAAGKWKLSLWWDGPCPIGNDGAGYASGVGPKFSPGDNSFTSDADGTGTVLDTNTVYRLEQHIWMVTQAPDAFGMEVRLYDSAGALMFQDGGTGLTKMSSNANNSLVTDDFLSTLSGNLRAGDGISAGTSAVMRGCEVGTNGGAAHAAVNDFHYFGKYAVGSTGWIGA